MILEKVDMYKIDGKVFDTKKKAVDHIERRIEKVITEILNGCDVIPPRSQIQLIDGVLKRRLELAKLLGYEDETIRKDHQFCDDG